MPEPRGYAKGGRIPPRPDGDRGIAGFIENGYIIMAPAASAKYGKAFLRALNRRRGDN